MPARWASLTTAGRSSRPECSERRCSTSACPAGWSPCTRRIPSCPGMARGTTGLETAFAVLYTELVMSGQLELGTVIERMTAGAALYDLPTPRIAPGSEADLTLVDLETKFEVGADGYFSRSQNNCFHGRTL